MAKLTSIPKKQRGPSHRGRVMIDTFNGTIRVRKWPTKTGPPKSALQQRWVDWFTQANRLAKYADDLTQRAAIELTRGTGQYPRDVILKAMRGRLYTITGPDGWRYYPMAAIGDISETLDVLAQKVGSILYRAADRWRGLDPGVVSQVFTSQGPDAAPTWETPGGAGGWLAGALVDKLVNQSIAFGTLTPVDWTSEVYDTASLHDNVINPSRMTIPPGWTRCRLTAGITWANSNTGNRIIEFVKNGALFPGSCRHRKLARELAEDCIASPVLECAEDDYFEVRAWHNKTGSWNLIGPSSHAFFSCERVS